MADTEQRSKRNRYFKRPTAVDRQERTDPRGASYTGAPGQTKTKTTVDLGSQSPSML